MFKRLFILSGIIAFILACALMYFWYLPNHLFQEPKVNEHEAVVDVDSGDSDSLTVAMPLE